MEGEDKSNFMEEPQFYWIISPNTSSTQIPKMGPTEETLTTKALSSLMFQAAAGSVTHV